MNRRDSRPPSNRPRVKAAASPGERLQKVLAAHGLGSRREIDAWVAAGRVSVDGTVAMPGTRVSGSERIRIDGQLVRLGARSRVARVLHPGLDSFRGHALAARQMSGFGGMLTIEVEGGGKAAAAVAARFKLFAIAASLGGVERLATQCAQRIMQELRRA